MTEQSVIGERLVPERYKLAKTQYLLYLRHLFVYETVLGELSEGETILEVGSGEGYGTSLLAGKAGRIVGVDLNPEAVSHAAKKYGSDNCEFVSYDGGRLPFPDGSFTCAVSFQVIEHVQDDEAFVREIARVLKPGGRCYLSTPNKTHRLEPGQKPWNVYHVREYYPEELETLMSRHFQQVELRGVMGRGEVQDIQVRKVKHHSGAGYLARRLLPEWLKLVLVRTKERFVGLFRKKNYLEEYGTDSYLLIREDIGRSLDLFAFARK